MKPGGCCQVSTSSKSAIHVVDYVTMDQHPIKGEVPVEVLLVVYIYLPTLYLFNTTVFHLKDRSIAVWDMQSPTDINLRRVLVGHRAAVNVVDFDDKYIVSASGDRTIKV